MTGTKPQLPDQLAQQERGFIQRDRFIRTLTMFLLVGIWVVVTEMHWVKPLFLPAPQDLWEAMKNLVVHLPEDLFASLIRRILPGFAIGVTLGILIGVLMSMNRVGKAVFEPIVEILRPLPPLALIPLLILWFGIGYITQILLIAYGSFIIMVVN